VKVDKHSDFNPCHRPSATIGSPVFLIPELVYTMPIPRDFLYAASMADKFMPALERKIVLQAFAQFVLSKDSTLHPEPDCVPSSPSQNTGTSFSLVMLLVDLVDQATTTFPPTSTPQQQQQQPNRRQRLEFLGTSNKTWFVTVCSAISLF
jgi:hypothetical protein